MAIDAHALPSGFDPLIAEAKRRANRRRLVLVVAAVAISAVFGTTLRERQKALPPATSQLPSLLVNAGARSLYRWQVRPADAWILFTGDGSGRLGGAGGRGVGHPGHVTWTRWTRTQAIGSGVIWATDNFKRTVTRYRATVRAFRPINGHFTRLTLRYRDNGTHYTDTRRIGRSGGWWHYAGR
jgi:hypothetical protein